MVRVFNQSLDNIIVLDPYYFMLELIVEPRKNYQGNVSLVIAEKVNVKEKVLNKI